MSKAKNSCFNDDGSLKKRVNAGSFKIASAKENDDGSISYVFEYDEAFAEYYKLQTGKKRITEKGINKFILELIEKEKSNNLGGGHTIKKLKPEKKRKFFKVYK